MKPLPRVLAALVLALTPIAWSVLPSDPAAAQARRQWRRGDVLPEAVLRGGPNVNYAAQRLRRPPEGYGWFAMDGQFLLASLSNGLILEVAD